MKANSSIKILRKNSKIVVEDEEFSDEPVIFN